VTVRGLSETWGGTLSYSRFLRSILADLKVEAREVWRELFGVLVIVQQRSLYVTSLWLNWQGLGRPLSNFHLASFYSESWAVLKQAAQLSMPHEVDAEAQGAEPEAPTNLQILHNHRSACPSLNDSGRTSAMSYTALKCPKVRRHAPPRQICCRATVFWETPEFKSSIKCIARSAKG